jgi:Na+:H+ antiporter, NhaA family
VTSSNSGVAGRPISVLREFLHNNASGGIVLVAAAIAALAWSNSPLAGTYDALWDTKAGVSIGSGGFTLTLRHWINDGLMAIFFLYVGLEIKREILIGELDSVRRALLPAAAAIGGAVLPALIFIGMVGLGSADFRGWGIPMATDIAFALGVLALVGDRVPLAVRVFVTALAIVDDLLAVVVIAIFYTAELSVAHLAAAGVILLLLGAANRFGARRPLIYGVLGIALWFAVMGSGIHGTVAGVLLALTIPARGRVSRSDFLARARRTLDELTDFADRDPQHRQAKLAELRSASRELQAPMIAVEHALSRWVTFVIVPVFALANAGVAITGDVGGLVANPAFLGIVFGLIVGKQIGITAAVWLVVRSGLAELPAGVSWRLIYGAAWLCGIGFTMSLFIADLAFGGSETLRAAKVAILVASISAGAIGFAILRFVTRRSRGKV